VKFKLDENLPVSAMAILASAGHDEPVTIRVRDGEAAEADAPQGFGGAYRRVGQGRALAARRRHGIALRSPSS